MITAIKEKLFNYTLRELVEENQRVYSEVLESVSEYKTDESDLDIITHIHEIKNGLMNIEKTSLYRNRLQVDKLKNTIQYEQRTAIWYAVRKNMITATNIAGIIGCSKYDSRKDILEKKLGMGKPFTGNAATEHGKCYEDTAIQLYDKRMNTEVREYGLIRHSKMAFLGASPDGITDDGIMVEIKCPPMRKIDGNVYKMNTLGYFIQMQTQMEVCDLDICDFLECHIVDYNTRREFLDDGENDFYGSNGLEKGVVGVSSDKETGENMYFHPPIHMTLIEKEEYIKEKQKEVEDTHYEEDSKYWSLKKYSVTRVDRDRGFFENIRQQLYDFWNEVLEIRDNMKLFDERYGKKKRTYRKTYKKPEPVVVVAGFSDDDFSDD